MRISLVVTLLNEAAHLPDMLEAIDMQSRPPDEVVMVDGGSIDGSLGLLRSWAAGRDNTHIHHRPGANISAGRNAAIRLATGPVIAVTDAGCTPDPGWLAALDAGLEDGVEVAMGYYRPDPQSRFERIMGCLNLPDAAEVDPDGFMPSSRSVAFHKSVWERAGGYPEWLEIGEDMYFNFRILELGVRRRFVPEAQVRWRLRPDLRSTLRQYYRYGRGDGRAGMHPRRHALRFATYSGAAALLGIGLRRPAVLAALPVAGAARMRPAYRRAFSRLSRREARQALAALPALELLIDLAKMAGYVAGRSGRRLAECKR